MATRTVAKELKKKTPKKLKDVNAPKAPLSAYFRFGQEQRKKDPSVQALTVGQQGKMLSEMWKQISEEDKEVYRKEYLKEKEKYQVELEAYKKTDTYKNWLKQKEALAEVKGGKKKKRSSQSGYNVYFKEQYPILAASNEGDDKPQMKDIAALIAKQWKLISEEEKAPYKEKAEEYNKKMIDSENASKDESDEEEEEVEDSDDE